MACALTKSSCIGYPYHSNDAWAALRRNDPASFADAVAANAALRAGGADAYLHRSRKPLAEVDFSADDGQGDMFECEGLCGT